MAWPGRRPQLAKGLMQLYSFEQQKSQPLEAHAAAFANVKVGTGTSQPVSASDSGPLQLRRWSRAAQPPWRMGRWLH